MGILQGFLHPALLWGLTLGAVPILIHILNRRRHRPLTWGAMRFVQAAYRRTRRRVQLYRGVYPVAYDITHSDPQLVNRELIGVLRGMGHVEEGDLVIITKGELTGVSGGTNSMKILRVSGQ